MTEPLNTRMGILGLNAPRRCFGCSHKAPQGTEQQPCPVDTTPAIKRLRVATRHLEAEFATLRQHVATLERSVSTACSDGGRSPASARTEDPEDPEYPDKQPGHEGATPLQADAPDRVKTQQSGGSVASVAEAATVHPECRTGPDPSRPDQVIDTQGMGTPEREQPHPDEGRDPVPGPHVGIAGPAAGGSGAPEPAVPHPTVPGGTKPRDTAGPRGSSQLQPFKVPTCLRKRFHCLYLWWYAKAFGVLFRERSGSTLLVTSANLLSIPPVYQMRLAHTEQSEFPRRRDWIGMISA